MVFSIRKTIPNALRALWRVLSLLVQKLLRRSEAPVLVSAGVAAARKACCVVCPEYEASSDQCLVCTCFVGIKTQFATETCPRNRWPK